jgi:hypothetical protein
MKKPGLAAWLGSHHPTPRTHEIAGSNPASPTTIMSEKSVIYFSALPRINTI